MKILFLSQIVPYPPHGGVLQRGYNLIREIGRRNDLHLLAFIHPDVLGNNRLIEESRTALGKHCRKIEYVELWAKKSKLHNYAGLLWGWISSLPFGVLAHRSESFRKAMKRIVEEDKIDLLHYDTIALAQFEDRVQGIPRVLSHHNIESQLMERRSAREERLPARIYTRQQATKIRAYELAQCRKFDLNITVSAADAVLLEAMVPGINLAIVPNGVDVEYFKSDNGNGPQEPAVIYTGGMNMFANRDAVMYFLRDIWMKIKEEVPQAKFYAVGQDPPSELLRMGGKENGVVITGYVDDIRPYVYRSSVYIVPLRVGGGTRLKILDAMAMSKAIVSTSVGCEGIDVENDKNILIADDPIEFAQRTVELLKNRAKRTFLGKGARELVEAEYSWGKIGRTLQEAYEGAVKKRREEAGR
jgi:sugar transferase (PEP-CTERM/EpsH1 system associated)